MAFCINCGAEVASDATFCHSCGGTLQGGAASAPPPPAQPVEETPAAEAAPGWPASLEMPSTSWTPEAPAPAESAWPAVDSGAAGALGGSADATPPAWSAPAPSPTPGTWTPEAAPPPAAWSAPSSDPTPVARIPAPEPANTGWPPSLGGGAAASGAPTSVAPTPVAHASRTAATTVPNHLVPAILSMLCCCLPVGVVSLVYAIQANTKASAGLVDEALQCANTAKTWMWVAVGLGVLGNGIIVLGQILMLIANS